MLQGKIMIMSLTKSKADLMKAKKGSKTDSMRTRNKSKIVMIRLMQSNNHRLKQGNPMTLRLRKHKLK